MKRLKLVLLKLAVLNICLIGQIENTGLILYNNYLAIPTYNKPDSFLNIDINGYVASSKDFSISNFASINSIVALKPLNSAIRFYGDFINTGPLKTKKNGLGYSFFYDFSDKLGIFAGSNFFVNHLMIDRSMLYLADSDDPILSADLSKLYLNGDLGFGVTYSTLVIGCNKAVFVSYPFNTKYNPNENITISVIYTTPSLFNISLKPVFRLYKNYFGEFYNYGILADYNKKFSVGFSNYYDRVYDEHSYSILTSVSFAKRFEFILQLKTKYSNIYESEYGLNLLGQLCFNL